MLHGSAIEQHLRGAWFLSLKMSGFPLLRRAYHKGLQQVSGAPRCELGIFDIKPPRTRTMPQVSPASLLTVTINILSSLSSVLAGPTTDDSRHAKRLR